MFVVVRSNYGVEHHLQGAGDTGRGDGDRKRGSDIIRSTRLNATGRHKFT